MTDMNTEIDIMKFASYRKKEMDLLRNDAFLTKAVKHKSLFQLLPRHMRRRTMGYLRKRLPHRIRKAALIKPPAKINKRPSRKHRRRPANLLSEYARRKRATVAATGQTKMWLETHIWHAKRFHMSESTFGYRLPIHDNCKCKRAVFRSMRKHCCMHDESYHVCLQLVGKQDRLVAGLARLCSTQAGLTFRAKMCLNGGYEGSVVLYEADKYPFGCIGPVRFLWRTTATDNNETDDEKATRTLWIWCHPAIEQRVQSCLVDVFRLELESAPLPPPAAIAVVDDDPSCSPAKKRRVPDEESAASTTTTNNASLYVSAHQDNCTDEDRVCFKSLKDKLVRFKLIGPMSTSVLGNVLRPVASEQDEFYARQAQVWESIRGTIGDPSQAMASMVIGLLVVDPRLMMPKKKSFNKSRDECEKQADTAHEKSQILRSKLRGQIHSQSTIWDEGSVRELNRTKKSTHAINKMRSEFLLPNTELSSLANHSRVPILLIQHQQQQQQVTASTGGLMTGWDLIVPHTWAMAFWLPLIHFGARAIAQQELNYLLYESECLQFPSEYVDTEASKAVNLKLSGDLYKKYLSRLPSKRVNHLKLAFLSPFHLPLKTLVNIHGAHEPTLDKLDSIGYFVLRNRPLLAQISTALFNHNKQRQLSNVCLSEDELHKSFTAVRLVATGKGSIDKFSLLYLSQDTQCVSQQKLQQVNHLAIEKLVANYKKEVIARWDKENPEAVKTNPTASESEKAKVKKITPMNKLIRSKFNKNALLADESKFNEFCVDMLDCSEWPKAVGVVTTGGFSLLNGKPAANALIMTKHLMRMIDNKRSQQQPHKKKQSGSMNDSTAVYYRTPSSMPGSHFYKHARIAHIYNH